MSRFAGSTKADNLQQKVLRCVNEMESWHLSKNYEKEELTIFTRKSEEFNGRMFKAEGIVEASPETCFLHCNPKLESTRASWDKAIKEIEILEKLQEQPEMFILRTMTHGAVGGMISGRDFVDIIVNVKTDEMFGILAESVEVESCPPTKQFVRGNNHYCGILCFSIPGVPSKTKLVYLIQTEVGGRLPLYLVESAVPTAICDFYNGLRNQIKLGQNT